MSYFISLISVAAAACCLQSVVASAPSSWCAFGDAMDFTGYPLNREYVDVGPLTLGSALTVEAWVWSADSKLDSWKVIASRARAFFPRNTDVPNPDADFVLQVDNHGLPAFFVGNGIAAPWQYGFLLIGSEVVPSRQWIHMAATISPGSDGLPKRASLYVDGELVDTDVWGDGQRSVLADGPTGSHVRVGAYDNTDFDKQFWHGFIDEVRFWAVVRSAFDIQSSMFVRFTGVSSDTLPGGLVSYLAFDDVRNPNNASAISDIGRPGTKVFVQFDGIMGPTYFVPNRVCTDDHLLSLNARSVFERRGITL